MPVPIAPWGRFPQGPAYAYPRESTNRQAYGWPVLRAPTRVDYSPGAPASARGLRGFAGACGPCQIASSSECVPCPDGSDLPECSGCVEGSTATSFWEHPLFAPVAVGVVTAVATAVVFSLLARYNVPVQGG